MAVHIRIHQNFFRGSTGAIRSRGHLGASCLNEHDECANDFLHRWRGSFGSGFYGSKGWAGAHGSFSIYKMRGPWFRIRGTSIHPAWLLCRVFLETTSVGKKTRELGKSIPDNKPKPVAFSSDTQIG